MEYVKPHMSMHIYREREGGREGERIGVKVVVELWRVEKRLREQTRRTRLVQSKETTREGGDDSLQH